MVCAGEELVLGEVRVLGVRVLAAAALLEERTDLVEVAEAEVTLFDRPDEPHPAIRTTTTNPPATKRQLTSPDYAPYTSINRS